MENTEMIIKSCINELNDLRDLGVSVVNSYYSGN